VACIELSGYALAVAAAARRKGVSLGLYARAVTLPPFAWHDRRLERTWRGGDPVVVEELGALYGEGLTVRDLLP
jgi:hypothetical protein